MIFTLQRNWRRYLAALMLAAVVVALPLTPVRAASTSDNDPALQRLLVVYDLIRNYYLHETDPQKLMTGAIRGMLATLDPYSVYFDPQELDQFNTQLAGEFGGIGIQPDKVDDAIVVTSVLPNSPAEQVGMKPGDQILAVDGKSVRGLSLDDVLPLVRGKPGSTVILTLQRDKQTLEVQIVRYLIQVPSMDSRDLGDGIRYIRLTEFTQDSGKNLKALVDVFRTQGTVRGIVLDLRDDPGGYLGEALTAGEAFIGSGPIVNVLDRAGHQQTYNSTSAVALLPVAVLVNGGTASASEVLAGALQDSGVGTLVGTHTYGKGVIQSMVPLADGAAVKLTTMKYQTPKGHDILPGKGLTPDVLVDTPALPELIPLVHTRDLNTGSIGLDVQALQQRLASLGYQPGTADGIYGGMTTGAVRAFQQAKSLPATGIANAATVKALNDQAAADLHRDPQLDQAIEVLKGKLK
ncbi:MAG: S41 family peptidase [Symbiobacteriia bacterium]